MSVTVEIARRSDGAAVPPGSGFGGPPVWRCPKCEHSSPLASVRANLMVCPECGYHARIGARERIAQLVDAGSFKERWSQLKALDPLQFTDLETYPERVREAQAKTGLTDAMLVGTATIASVPCVLTVMDFGFMGGSMGSVVGEKIWRAADLACTQGLPFVSVCSSGGARMQEGILSLMQMAKTTCAVDMINEAGVPFVAVLADPCTGGVIASFATLADICIAEPGALLAFSGPRVIAETTKEQLPADFATAERNLVLGHLDAVVPRALLREKVGNYLRLLEGGGTPERIRARRKRGRSPRGLAETAAGRAKKLVAYAGRKLGRGDREVDDSPQDLEA